MFSWTGLANTFEELAGALAPALPHVVQQFGADSGHVLAVQNGINVAQEVAASLATADSSAAVQPGISTTARVTQNVGAALAVLAQVAMPPQVAIGVRLAEMALPVASTAISVLAAHGMAPKTAQLSSATG